jgi:hypothetical protein
MGGVQKIALGIVAVGMVTVLVSHASGTAGAVGAFQHLFTNSLATSMGTKASGG